MNNPDAIHPPGATHIGLFYGHIQHYQQIKYPHLNQVSEEWQTRINWRVWNIKTNAWEAVGAGFNSRLLKELDSGMKEKCEIGHVSFVSETGDLCAASKDVFRAFGICTTEQQELNESQETPDIGM